MRLAAALLVGLPLFAQEHVRHDRRFPKSGRATFVDLRTPTLDVLMRPSSPGGFVLHELAKTGAGRGL